MNKIDILILIVGSFLAVIGIQINLKIVAGVLDTNYVVASLMMIVFGVACIVLTGVPHGRDDR